jgi:hypothetical protein
MPKKKPPAKGEKSQKERFLEAAKSIGADESGRAFEKAVQKIVPPKSSKARPPTA